jgi:hypothetical protein
MGFITAASRTPVARDPRSGPPGGSGNNAFSTALSVLDKDLAVGKHPAISRAATTI